MKVEDVLRIASHEEKIGYKEGKNNDTKYGVWYGLNNQPWCYIFISWVFHQAGSKLGKCASCPQGMAWYKNNKRWYSVGLPGDIAFFQFRKDLSYPQHVGIVVSVNKSAGTVTTIEGNTSSGVTGSQSNGDGVYKRVRRLSDVMGFGRPDYNKV